MVNFFVLGNKYKYVIDPKTREMKRVFPEEEVVLRKLIVEEILELSVGKEPRIKVTVIDKGFEDHPYLSEFYPFEKVIEIG